MSDLVDGGHVPVLAAEVMGYLGDGGRGVVVDCTVGLGGHSAMLLGREPGLRVVGIDADEGNLERARSRLAGFGERVRLVCANFAELGAVVKETGWGPVGGILADLGLSSNQIEEAGRGFSFELDGPLDMRIDQSQGPTAADLVNTLGEGELSDLLYFQSQEQHSRKIARRICQARRQMRLNSTVMLARLVAAAMGENPESHRRRIHPATRTFMALRMAVNRETDSLKALLAAAAASLRSGGRIVVISFHSVEDGLVKADFRERGRAGEYRILTKKPMGASEEERAGNPRSRSAKMRVAEKA